MSILLWVYERSPVRLAVCGDRCAYNHRSRLEMHVAVRVWTGSWESFLVCSGYLVTCSPPSCSLMQMGKQALDGMHI